MATVSRNIASIKSFYAYLMRERIVNDDPTENIKPPKIVKKVPETLTISEVNKLLDQPPTRLQRRSGIRRCWSCCMLQEYVLQSL